MHNDIGRRFFIGLLAILLVGTCYAQEEAKRDPTLLQTSDHVHPYMPIDARLVGGRRPTPCDKNGNLSTDNEEGRKKTKPVDSEIAGGCLHYRSESTMTTYRVLTGPLPGGSGGIKRIFTIEEIEGKTIVNIYVAFNTHNLYNATHLSETARGFAVTQGYSFKEVAEQKITPQVDSCLQRAVMDHNRSKCYKMLGQIGITANRNTVSGTQVAVTEKTVNEAGKETTSVDCLSLPQMKKLKCLSDKIPVGAMR